LGKIRKPHKYAYKYAGKDGNKNVPYFGLNVNAHKLKAISHNYLNSFIVEFSLVLLSTANMVKLQLPFLIIYTYFCSVLLGIDALISFELCI
jgi:hypothetical protein